MLNNQEKPFCPYLGIRGDSDTAQAYPSGSNRCYYAKPLTAVNLEHQRVCCLTADYDSCAMFLKKQGSSLPKDLRFEQHRSGRPIRSSRNLVLFFLLVIVIAVLIVWQVLAGGLAIPSFASPTSLQTASSPSSLSLTLTPVTSPSPVADTPTATAQPVHALETPIGNEYKFVIHRIREGESLDLLGRRYGTTVEAIQAVNYAFSSPIIIDKVIIIPKGWFDVKGLPSFEAYMVTEDGITIEEFAQQKSVDPILLKLYNTLPDGYRLSAGEWLLIPHVKTP